MLSKRSMRTPCLIHQSTLTERFRLGHFYPVSQPANSEGSFSRLNTPAAFSRVVTLLKNSKGVVVAGGETDESIKYIAPTIVRDVNGDDSLMSE